MFNIIRLVIVCALIYFIYRIIKWIFFTPLIKSQDMPGRQTPTLRGEDLVEDPYCHIYLPVSQAYKKPVDGQDLYFCSQKCLEQYILENTTKKAREVP